MMNVFDYGPKRTNEKRYQESTTMSKLYLGMSERLRYRHDPMQV